MKLISLVLAMLPQQDPAPAPPGRADVVVLEDGSRLEGRITRETSGYLELRLGAGALVGFEKRRVQRIERGAGPVEKKAPSSTVPLGETWFVVHDGEGKAAGRLHASVTRDDAGHLRFGEEWWLRGPRGPLEITVLEVADAELRPRSCFYHERSRDAGGQLLHERIVRAERRGAELVIETRGTEGRTRDRRPFSENAGFPLVIRARLLREPPAVSRSFACVVFDPATETLARRVYELHPLRRLRWGTRELRARELVVRFGERTISEWVDARGASLRRQVNGPALVALPASEDRARHLPSAREAVWAPSMRRTGDGDLALWLPHPGWTFSELKGPGQVGARNARTGAVVSLVRLDHLGSELTEDEAADAVVRWLRLAEPGFTVTGRRRSRWRDRPAVELEAVFERHGRAGLERRRALVVVASVRGRHVALCATAPAERWPEVYDDLTRIRDTVELHAEVLRPARPAVAGAVAVSR